MSGLRAYLRDQYDRPAAPRRFGPKSPDHPTVGQACPGCGEPFQAGDYTALVVIGPGDDPGERQRAADGRPYNAVAVEAHWQCVTGREGE